MVARSVARHDGRKERRGLCRVRSQCDRGALVQPRIPRALSGRAAAAEDRIVTFGIEPLHQAA